MLTNRAAKAQHTIDDFIDRVLVVCPRCSKMATVTSTSGRRRARLVCEKCGLAKSKEVSSYVVGQVADPYFVLPLWLQAPCSTHTVWAYNRSHLTFLKEYVESSDRRRPIRKPADPLNKLLASRLPRWMLLAKNRDQILKAITVIEAKLANAG
jgi:hypothetical protein